MATLKYIRKRISSVKNTQKVTKAMKMVSAAKLRKAQQRLMNVRPYEETLGVMVSEMIRTVDPSEHPLLRRPTSLEKGEVLLLTSDRGLCGGFNSNLLRKIETLKDVRLHVIGRKGRDFFKARHRELKNFQTGLYDGFDFSKAVSLAEDIAARYTAQDFDCFYLAYNGFKSSATQEIQIRKILPLVSPEFEVLGFSQPVIYEPSLKAILDQMLPRWLAMQIYRAFLESMASEQGARMVAMDGATNNCREMIGKLTMQMNRARQAAITTELMDIVNGAEALK